MTKLIAVAQQKGGCGKTTVSINLATCLTTRQKNVLLVDADPQGSATEWASRNESYDFPVIQCNNGKNLKKFLDNADYDYVVIDCAPRMESELASFLAISDLALLPFQPSPLDFWACENLIDMIKTRQHLVSSFKARFLLNGAHSLSNLQHEIREELEKTGIEPLNSTLMARTVYRRVLNKGLSVIHSNDEKAMKEVEELTTKVLEVIHD